jgi:hypothetical protein
MWRPPTPYSHLRTGSPVKSAIALLRPPEQRKSPIEGVIRLERTSEFSLLPERINSPESRNTRPTENRTSTGGRAVRLG